MTLARALFFLAVFAALAIVIIGLRAEQVRAAASIERLERARVALRREGWALQAEIARVRAPMLMRERVQRWSLDMTAPVPPSERYTHLAAVQTP